ncbi:MLX-interacting protein [Nymphon striatum]|nr:MLX-interacting protein [Nymphon striatum]
MTQDDYLVRRNKEGIHSGHFMVSDIDDNDIEEVRESDDVARDEQIDSGPAVSHHGGQPLTVNNASNQQVESTETTVCNFRVEDGFDFQSACKETSNTYKFGPRSAQSISIDASLSKLFQCMTLAYSGKLSSPRWKNFKGLKLKWKDKIRLNNIIWRAWHMQFVVKKKPNVCQFATRIDSEIHNKPEAVVLEGKYWKRKMDNVIAEYKSWRIYHKNRQNNKFTIEFDFDLDFLKWPCNKSSSRKPLTPPASLGSVLDDDAIMDVSDTLFSCISQPFAFPNFREISHGGGLADFIQPGLAQLQPNLDDFMDTFEQLPDSFTLKQFLQDCTEPMQLATHFNQVDSFLGIKVPNDLSSVPNILNSNADASSINVFAPDSNLETFKLPTSSQSNLSASIQFQTVHPCQTSNGGNDTFKDAYSIDSKLSTFCTDAPLEPIGSATDFATNFLPFPNINVPNIVSNHSQTQVLPNECNNVTQNQILSFPDGSNDTIVHHHTQSLADVSSAIPPNNSSLSNETQIRHPMQQVSSLSTVGDINHHHCERSTTTSNITLPVQSENLLSSLDSTSNIIQPHIYKDTIPSTSNIIRHTCGSVLTFFYSSFYHHMTAPQAKFRRSSVSSSSKSSALRRSSHPACMRNSRGRTCVPIAPNTQLKTSATSEPNSRKISIVSGPNATNPSFLPSNTVIAQVMPAGYPHVSSLTSTQIAEPPVTIFNNLTSTEAKSGNILKETPSSPFTSTVILSPVALASSNSKSSKTKSPVDQANYKEHRRVVHINAEQKRRFNIKYGFNIIQNLVPSLNHNGNTKVSKAQMLQKGVEKLSRKNSFHLFINLSRMSNDDYMSTFQKFETKSATSHMLCCCMINAADYIRHMKNQKAEMARENECIKKEIEALNNDINALQAQLPITGAPISNSNSNSNANVMADMFEEYIVVSRQVKEATRVSFTRPKDLILPGTMPITVTSMKCYSMPESESTRDSSPLLKALSSVFSIIIRPLFEKYDRLVHTTSIEEFCRSVLSWLDQYCSLVYFRPAVSNSLRRLSTTTDILSNPSSVKDEATKAVSQGIRDKHR